MPVKRSRQSARREPHRDDGKGEIERRPERRLLVANPARVKTRRAEPDPIEEARLDEDRGRIGESKPAVFLGAEKFRDQKPDHEIHKNIAK